MTPELAERTRSHYDEYPFIEGGPNRIAWWRDYLSPFLPDDEIRGRLILDVGSSVGEISRGLADRGAQMVCLDISLQSLRRCRQINPEAQLFHASALRLPFPDESFDDVISIGVLHHTPDCRGGFREVARVARPGATIVVFLYNYWSIYNVAYHAFTPVRCLMPLERVPRWGLALLQPFARWHLGQKLNDRELRNLLGDKLWTPQATFHSVSEVRRWGEEEGLEMTAWKRFFLGYANVMQFRKRGTPDAEATREVVVSCSACGRLMSNALAGVYSCVSCGHEYHSDGGVWRCYDEAPARDAM